jgi:hypothetical protein
MSDPEPDNVTRQIAAQVLEDVANHELLDALYGMGGTAADAELHRTVLRLLSGYVPREVLLAESERFRRAL